jgi:outer membrane immunogenic protein
VKNLVSVAVSIALVLGCGCAWAAGPAAASYNWTGFYVGLNTGLAIDNSGYTLRPSGAYVTDTAFSPYNSERTDSDSLRKAAFTIGGQLGYNYQVGSFVFGFETDFNYNGTDDASYVNRPLLPHPTFDGNFVHTVKQQVDYFGTVRARFGFTPADRFLLYGTGGLAYGDVSSGSTIAFTSTGDKYTGSTSGVRAGWTLGAGSEYAFTNNWSAKFEYLYIDLGSRSYTCAVRPGLGSAYTYTADLDTTQHVIRVGLNYKF